MHSAHQLQYCAENQGFTARQAQYCVCRLVAGVLLIIGWWRVSGCGSHAAVCTAICIWTFYTERQHQRQPALHNIFLHGSSSTIVVNVTCKRETVRDNFMQISRVGAMYAWFWAHISPQRQLPGIRDQGSYVKENREKRQQTLRMSANLVRTTHLCNGHFCKQIYLFEGFDE